MILTSPKLLPQERLDLEDLLELMTGLTTDSQYFISQFWSSSQFILKGFTVSGVGSPSPATIAMANATLVNAGNTNGFSWYSAPAGASNQTIALSAGVRNYIEMQLSNADGTPLARAFWDPSADNGDGAEFSQTVNTLTSIQCTPIARTGSFSGSANTIPIAFIDTDNSNNIKLIMDKRPMFFRLINPQTGSSAYSWSSQTEPTTAIVLTGVSGTFTAGETITFSGGATATVVSYNSGTSTIQAKGFSSDSYASTNTVTGGSSSATGTVSTMLQSFTGADKDIGNLRDAYAALATEIKRIKGSAEWFNTGYGNIPGILNQIDSIIAASTTATAPKFAWDGTQLSITDSNGSPASSDNLGIIRILGSGITCNLRRQDGTASTSKISISDGQVLFVKLPASGSANYSGVGVGSTNYQVIARDSYVISDQNYWLAYREGSLLYIRNQGELSAGKSDPIGDEIPVELLNNIGFTSETAAAVYTSINFVSQSSSLVAAISALDSRAGTQQSVANQNKSMRLINGGNWSFVASSGVLTWSANANITIGGLADSVNQILASNVTLADGDVAYATINRTGVGGNITVANVAVASYVQADNSIVIARRVGAIVYMGLNAEMMSLQDGESKAVGQGGYIQTISLTAGENLTANQAGYISLAADGRSTGRAYKTDAGSTNGALRGTFSGFVMTAATTGNPVTLICDGQMGGFTSLTAGALCYLDPSTLGGITTTKPTSSGQYVVPVGIATSTTKLIINGSLFANSFGQIASASAYPNFFVASESDLSTAITSASGLGGGVICLASSFTIIASHTIPAGTMLLGRKGATILTFASSGALVFADDSFIKDVWMTTALSSGTLLAMSGNRCDVDGCSLVVPSASTTVCINVTGSSNRINRTKFSGVAGLSTGVGIQYTSGVENTDSNCMFLS